MVEKNTSRKRSKDRNGGSLQLKKLKVVQRKPQKLLLIKGRRTTKTLNRGAEGPKAKAKGSARKVASRGAKARLQQHRDLKEHSGNSQRFPTREPGNTITSRTVRRPGFVTSTSATPATTPPVHANTSVWGAGSLEYLTMSADALNRLSEKHPKVLIIPLFVISLRPMHE